MTRLIFILFMFIFSVHASDIKNAASALEFSTESTLYNQWAEQWGDYKWSYGHKYSGAGNKEYSLETSYAIIEMIDKNDVVGLRKIYEVLKKDKEHNMKFLNEIIGEPSFELAAIRSGSVEALQFLLDNGISNMDKNTLFYLSSDSDEKGTPIEVAQAKLNEAKAKGDSKLIQNYKKIIELLKKYGYK